VRLSWVWVCLNNELRSTPFVFMTIIILLLFSSFLLVHCHEFMTIDQHSVFNSALVSFVVHIRVACYACFN
jgi:phosphatidylserine synthase